MRSLSCKTIKDAISFHRPPRSFRVFYYPGKRKCFTIRILWTSQGKWLQLWQGSLKTEPLKTHRACCVIHHSQSGDHPATLSRQVLFPCLPSMLEFPRCASKFHLTWNLELKRDSIFLTVKSPWGGVGNNGKRASVFEWNDSYLHQSHGKEIFFFFF